MAKEVSAPPVIEDKNDDDLEDEIDLDSDDDDDLDEDEDEGEDFPPCQACGSYNNHFVDGAWECWECGNLCEPDLEQDENE